MHIDDAHVEPYALLSFIDYQLSYHEEESVRTHLESCQTCARVFEEQLAIVSGLMKASAPAQRRVPTKGDLTVARMRKNERVFASMPEVPLYRLVDRTLRAYVVLERFMHGLSWVYSPTSARLHGWVKMQVLAGDSKDEWPGTAPTDQELMDLTHHLADLVTATRERDRRYDVFPLLSLSRWLTQEPAVVADEFMAAYVANDLIMKRLGLAIDRKVFASLIDAIENHTSSLFA